ncbi:MAG: crotonase/enoyl-CoA hydratase family protein [Myxococcales bacterium]|nr:crotonase/enoyl-CoA hydratase family protein [Myxococcales bacterium]
MSDLVSLRIDDNGVATITLDDGKANALSPAMLGGIQAALDGAEKAGATVLLAGRSGRFSGGFDLSVLSGGGLASLDLLRSGFELAHRLLSFPTGVVVACTGHAIAMGAFLVCAGDHRIGIQGGGHRICANEVALGMTMPHAAIEICKLRLTPSALQQAVVLAAPYDHERAVAAGFLDEVVPGDQLLPAAHAAALRIKGLSPTALSATKLRLRDAALAALSAAIERDNRELRHTFGV